MTLKSIQSKYISKLIVADRIFLFDHKDGSFLIDASLNKAPSKWLKYEQYPHIDIYKRILSIIADLEDNDDFSTKINYFGNEVPLNNNGYIEVNSNTGEAINSFNRYEPRVINTIKKLMPKTRYYLTINTKNRKASSLHNNDIRCFFMGTYS